MLFSQSKVSELDVRKVRQVTGEYRGKVNHLMAASEDEEHSDVLLHLHSLVSLLEEKVCWFMICAKWSMEQRMFHLTDYLKFPCDKENSSEERFSLLQ